LQGLFVLPQRGAKLRLNQSRTDGIDADAVAGPLAGHNLCEAQKRRLAHAVQAQARLGTQAADAAYVDDRSAAATNEMRMRDTRQLQWRFQVDAKDFVECRIIRFEERTVHGVRGSIVHDNIDAAIALTRRIREMTHGSRIADVGGDRGGFM